MYQRLLGTLCEKDRERAVYDKKMASRTLHIIHNHVLVTYFTIDNLNKSTFVQRCLIGNMLSRFS